MPNVDFGRQLDRPEGPQPEEGPILLLDPKPVTKRVTHVMNFATQLERPPSPQPKDVELLLDPRPITKRVTGAVDMEK